MSAWYQKQTWQRLFDHLVGERRQGRGHDDAERLCRFLIDHQRKLARLLDGRSPGLAPFKILAA
jgi:hypothetical protein